MGDHEAMSSLLLGTTPKRLREGGEDGGVAFPKRTNVDISWPYSKRINQYSFLTLDQRITRGLEAGPAANNRLARLCGLFATSHEMEG